MVDARRRRSCSSRGAAIRQRQTHAAQMRHGSRPPCALAPTQAAPDTLKVCMMMMMYERTTHTKDNTSPPVQPAPQLSVQLSHMCTWRRQCEKVPSRITNARGCAGRQAAGTLATAWRNHSGHFCTVILTDRHVGYVLHLALGLEDDASTCKGLVVVVLSSAMIVL